jgi:hypothetical protein
MKWQLRVRAWAAILSIALAAPDAALAQKAGGVLKIGHFDSPPACRCSKNRRPRSTGR